MRIKGWLPITTRNRVALLLAFVGLGMFLVWNCLPYYDWREDSLDQTVAVALWPMFFDLDKYLAVIRSPDGRGLFEATVALLFIINGLIVLLALPLWQILHASNFVRIPIALLNLLHGAIVTWLLFSNVMVEPEPYKTATFSFMGLSLLAVSAAFFLFKNELALRNEVNRPRAE